MSPHLKKSITLLELLIAITLLSVIVLGFTSIDLFSRFHVLTADRRAKVQNEVSYVLEHMAKNITGTNIRGGAIGNINALPINRANIGGNSAIRIRIDSNNNGQLDVQDIEIAYVKLSNNYQIWYYSDYTNQANSYDIISRVISSNFSNTYVVYDNTTNFIGVTIIGCWNPSGSPYACGTSDNPNVRMQNSIKMPSVSTN